MGDTTAADTKQKQMTRRYGRIFVTVSLAAFSASGWGDVIPIGNALLEQRAEHEPKAFDRADSYCLEKEIGNACTIPGSPLEGGGSGVCHRRINQAEASLDVICERELTPTINRDLPEGPFPAPQSFCGPQVSESVAQMFKDYPLSCDPVPLAKDRFCAGRTEGSSCTISFALGNAAEQQGEGHCHIAQQSRQYRFSAGPYRRGSDGSFTRDTLQCLPDHTVSHQLHKRPGWFERRFGASPSSSDDAKP